MRADVVVIGAGPAGLAAAVMLAEAGRQVRVVAQGNGFTHWGPGAVDVLGYRGDQPVGAPRDEIATLPDDHPYRLAGSGALDAGVAFFRRLTADAGLDHAGGLDANRRQVTALGTLRTTALLPEPAAQPLGGRVAVVGFSGFRDFSAELCAHGLRRAGFDATGATVELPPWDHRRYFLAPELARAFDHPDFRRRMGERIFAAAAEAGADTVVLPAVLGVDGAAAGFPGGHLSWADLQRQVGLPLVEAALPPPSIPGLRLFKAYKARINQLGVRWQFGMPVVGAELDGDRVTAILSAAANRVNRIACDEVVLATGGVAGRGIEAHRDGTLTEPVLDLPVDGFDHRAGFLAPGFLGEHPLARAGIRADRELRPVDATGDVLLANARIVGSQLAAHDPTAEASREGVALATAARAAELLARTTAAAAV